MKDNTGITLIALIVTIIIIIILAGVGVLMITSDSGILWKAKTAKDESDAATEFENQTLSNIDNRMQEYITGRSAANNSDLVTSVDFTSTTITPTQITFDITATTTVNGSAIVYYMFLNGKVVTGNTSNQITITNLTKDTSYTFRAGVIDQDGKFRISEEKQFKTASQYDLYNVGTLNSTFTGTWTSSGNGNQLQTLNASNIYFYNTATGSYSNRIFWTNKKMDLTGYTKLVIEWKVSSRSMCVFGITPNIPTFTNATNDGSGISQFSKYCIGSITSSNNIQTIDITNLNSGYMAFYLFDVKAYVYHIYIY